MSWRGGRSRSTSWGLSNGSWPCISPAVRDRNRCGLKAARRRGSQGSWPGSSARPGPPTPGGDHTLYVGEVADFNYRSGDALAFANSSFTIIPESQLGMENLL